MSAIRNVQLIQQNPDLPKTQIDQTFDVLIRGVLYATLSLSSPIGYGTTVPQLMLQIGKHKRIALSFTLEEIGRNYLDHNLLTRIEDEIYNVYNILSKEK